MPVSPATAEHLAAGVVAHYQDAEAALTARIAKNLAKGIDAPTWAADKLAQINEYERQARRLLADLEKKAATGIGTAITEAYDRGGLSAVADMAKMQMSDAMKYSAVEWQPTPLRPWVIREPDGRVLHKFDTAEKAQAFVDKHPAYMGAATPVEPLAGLRAVEALTRETLGNVLATHPGILRSTMDIYRSVIAESSSGILLGNQTRRQAAQAALNRFALKGVTGFVDRAGRGWSLSSYVEMATRTGAGRAAVQGHVDRLTANGLNLVIVSDAPRECPLCRKWEGKVLSIGGSYAGAVNGDFLAEGQTTYPTLDEARAAGLMHVACRHDVSAYQEGITRPMTNTADPEGYADTTKLRYLERQTRAAKRVELAAMDEPARKAAHAKVMWRQSQIREHVASTTAKRQRTRERLGAL